jgi:PAS domain S-box-containing protein
VTEATEISPQGGAEAVAEVRALNAALERRTAELEVALSNLQAQNSQRTQAEAALRESEQRYRRLVELSPEAILVIADEALVYVNAAGLRLFRAADATEMRDRPLRDLIHTEDVKRVLAGLRRLLSSGSDVAQAELRLRRIDNSALEAEISAAGVTFDGRPAVQVLVRDVGERRQMERMKDELLSIVSHELRTPLTSLRGSLGLLAGGLLGELPARGQRMLDIAVSNSDRLIRLLNDVLDLERMRSGRLTLELTECDAMDLVEQALAEMRGLAVRSKVMLSVGRVDGIVLAHPDRIVQVLTNLLSNAIKFSDPYGTVRLSAETHGNRVRFAVSDQGRGIPPDKLETIFERFQQVDASDSRDKGGTGLGLAICRSIVQQHGGRVWAESTLGQGSTFYVELRSASLARAAA